MKRSALIAAVAVTVAACGSSNSTPTGPSPTGPIVFAVQMSAANEVPPITGTESNGRGVATITMNVQRDGTGAVTGGGTVAFAVQLSGFPAGTPIIAAHIHPGAVGINGPALVSTGLTPAAPILLSDGSATLSLPNVDISAANAQSIVANPSGYYFNVHTPTNTAGAARGQLVRQQ